VLEQLIKCEANIFGDLTQQDWGEDGDIAHGSSYCNVLNSNEFGLKRGFAIFEKHCNNVVQVVIDLVQCLPLGMSTWKPRHEPNEQASLRASFNYR
jgi:hypothetical protein